MGAGLDFVTATVAGHLSGFHAAKAIDTQAKSLRDIRSLLTTFLERPETWNRLDVQKGFQTADEINFQWRDGRVGSRSSTASAMALYSDKLLLSDETSEDRELLINEGILTLSKAVDEMTRPIDSIRHQAKTVTVGISRPQDSLPSILLKALEILGAQPGWLKEQDKRVLKVFSQVIENVKGGMLYKVGDSGKPTESIGEIAPIQVIAKYGHSDGKPSRYDTPNPAGGSSEPR